MSHLHFTTPHANTATVKRNWLLIDASNATLGRLCGKIASVLRGKNKPYYTPHVDCGDYIVVTNAEKIILTGDKMNSKLYIHYTGYPGGKKVRQAKEILAQKPTFLIEKAVKGMLPKNRLGRQMFKKLFVYAGNEHPHTAQSPQPVQL